MYSFCAESTKKGKEEISGIEGVDKEYNRGIQMEHFREILAFVLVVLMQKSAFLDCNEGFDWWVLSLFLHF